MKLIRIALIGAIFSIVTAFGVFAEEAAYTKGVVKKVTPESGKVTIVHEEIVNLEMPAMTMVFRVSDQKMFEQLEPGAEIEFVAERVDGKLAVTDLK